MSPYLFEDLAVSFGIFNDNILCPYEAAKQGWSWGPDDQFSFGGTLKGSYRRFITGIDYAGITSRLLLYRFDYVKIALLYSMPLYQIGFCTFGGGFLFTGDAGGEGIQNGFHDFISYPHVNLPYSENRFSGLLRGGIAIDIYRNIQWKFLLQGYADGEVFITRGPHHLRTGLDCYYSFCIIDIEALAGYNCYTLLPDSLASIVKSGLYGGILFTFRITSYFNFSLGAGIFPVKNAADDPEFIKKEYSSIPQVWILFGYGEKGISIREFFVP